MKRFILFILFIVLIPFIVLGQQNYYNENISTQYFEGSLGVEWNNGVSNKLPIKYHYIDLSKYAGYTTADSLIINFVHDSLATRIFQDTITMKYGGRGSDSTGQNALSLSLVPIMRYPFDGLANGSYNVNDSIGIVQDDTTYNINKGAGRSIQGTILIDSIQACNIVYSFRVQLTNPQFRFNVFFNWADTSLVSNMAESRYKFSVSIQ